MPIKFPKGFQRRKSSGNALEELRNPPESSFKVFERPPNASSRSLDGQLVTRKAVEELPPPPISKNSFEQDEENLFSVMLPNSSNRYMTEQSLSQSKLTSQRASGGTDKSLSTAQYDSGASSNRLSTSTTPSSVDARSDKNVPVQGQPVYNDIPAPPPTSHRSSFLRNSARALTLGVGNRASKDLSTILPPPQAASAKRSADPSYGRDRATTTSSASTATPPRLFDSDGAFDGGDFEESDNMFDSLKDRIMRNESPVKKESVEHISYPPSSFPNMTSQRNSIPPIPVPPTRRNPAPMESSPFSFTSEDSRDELMRSPSPSKTITQTRSNGVGYPKSSAKNEERRTDLSRDYNARDLEDHAGLGLRVVPPDSDDEESLFPVSGQKGSAVERSLRNSADLAAAYQSSRPNKQDSKKVMTPAEFEHYKKQQDSDRRFGATAEGESDDEGDNYEDDDDLEKEREATKQRRKQEAHLAVYRQTMMKVTGELANGKTTSSLSLPLGAYGNRSNLDPQNRMSRVTADTRQSGLSSGDDEDEDEDVPLGILAAHGFPNKNRPPSKQITDVRVVSQQMQPTSSVVGESGKRGSLPVFARNLPHDPYFGAGLVNPSNRESFAAHTTNNMPVTPSGAATAHPLHPSGLVGVIAGEERARAMRRGSPNAQGNYDTPGVPPPAPGMMRSQTMGNMPQAGYPGMMPMMPGMPNMLTPGDQAQIQMSQQMTQMMQMQMQWMQQMQQMMGNQMNGGQPMPLPPMMQPGMGPNSLAPPDQMLRPQSMQMLRPQPSFPTARPQTMHVNSAPVLPGQRAMSTINPSMSSWNLAPSSNYAHSIAPSERSNVGLASRYRPVSTVIEPERNTTRRASTFTSSTLMPWSHPEGAPAPPAHTAKPSVSGLGQRPPITADDEDDEQGWAEMKAKKEKKQRSWKLRKGKNALQELYNGVP